MKISELIIKYEDLFPLVKILEVNGSLFAYDAKTHFLVEITIEHLNYIHDYYTKQEKLAEIPDYLLKLLQRKVFSLGKAIKLTPQRDEILDFVNYELANYIPRKFSLEVTEECTLRCKYCFYTNDDVTKRRHTFNNMKEDIAYKAIDYYYERYSSAIKKITPQSRDKVFSMLPPNLSWWGGEPLLNFDLIKKTKLYIESLDWGALGMSAQNIYYSIVTNLTIITDEILEFIVHNKIYVMISLDGDQVNHDKNRVFPNDLGSFNLVVDNIKYLMLKYPKYVKEYVTIQSVLANNIDTERGEEFINDLFLVQDKENKKILGWNKNHQRIEGEFIGRRALDFDMEKAISIFEGNLLNLKQKKAGELERIISSDSNIYYELLDLLSIDKFINVDNPSFVNVSKSFSCPIGSDTMFVSVNGNMHFCCKTDQSFPIGDINKGLDSSLIEQMYALYFSEIERHCIGCWAFHFCKICPALTCWKKKIKLPTEIECESIKKISELQLRKYIILNRKYESLYEGISIYFKKREANFKRDSKPSTLKDFNYEKD